MAVLFVVLGAVLIAKGLAPLTKWGRALVPNLRLGCARQRIRLLLRLKLVGLAGLRPSRLRPLCRTSSARPRRARAPRSAGLSRAPARRLGLLDEARAPCRGRVWAPGRALIFALV